MNPNLPKYELTDYAKILIELNRPIVEIGTHRINLKKATNEDMALLAQKGVETSAFVQLAPAATVSKPPKKQDASS